MSGIRTFRSKPITAERYSLGEGPVWDEAAERLIWVDILGGMVCSASLSGEQILSAESYKFDSAACCAVPTRDSGLLVACSDHLASVSAGGHVLTSPRLISQGQRRRFNDGACDPQGRFLVGTMSLDGTRESESLFSLSVSGAYRVAATGLTLSNGLGWSPDGATMYHIDSIPGVVWSIEYDLASGQLGRRRALLEIVDGIPDGLCVDQDGNLWIAIWGAGEVRCYSPAARQIARVEVSAPLTSSVAFAGQARDRLVITTACVGLTPQQLAANPDSGRLFISDVGASGLSTGPWGGDGNAMPWIRSE